MFEHRAEEREGGDDVVEVVFEGIADGFADVSEGGEVHDGVDAFLAEDFADGFLVAEVCLVKRDFRCDGGAVSEDEVVEDDGTVAGSLKLSHAMTSDITRSADYQYVHGEK